jgi:hypothetical protein
MRTYSAYRIILTAGLICGLLDAISAIVAARFFGGVPLRVFQGIASGLIGRTAFQGGISSALLGLGLHFVIATGAATVYYFASRSLPILLDEALVCGGIYGVLVHLFMTFVVIPLSAIGRRPFVPRTFMVYMAVAMIVIGPSISLTVRHFSRLSFSRKGIDAAQKIS